MCEVNAGIQKLMLDLPFGEPRSWIVACYLPGWSHKKMELGMVPWPRLRQPQIGCRHPKWHFNHPTTHLPHILMWLQPLFIWMIRVSCFKLFFFLIKNRMGGLIVLNWIVVIRAESDWHMSRCLKGKTIIGTFKFLLNNTS